MKSSLLARFAGALATSTVLLLAACDDGATGGTTCRLNSDCPTNQLCYEGVCDVECREDRDCAEGQTCSRGECTGGDEVDATDDVAAEDASGDSPDAATDAASGDTVSADTIDTSGPRPGGEGAISGRVHFRLYDDSEMPVSRPIIYWTLPDDPVDPLPTGASCDCGYPETAIRGNIDGSFVLEDVPAGWINLVVQKGYFRRVRTVWVDADSTLSVEPEVTELPVRNNPEAGDTIPRILVGTGRFDPVEDIFAKLRLGPITSQFYFDHTEWMEDPSAWGVDLALYQQPLEMDDNGLELIAPPFLDILGDPDQMDDYHFIFTPCAGPQDYFDRLTSPGVRDGIRTFVNRGGKLYTTDFAYDIVEQAFPTYIDFRYAEHSGSEPETDGNADGQEGIRALMGIASLGTLRYQSHNRALIHELRQWLLTNDASPDGFVLTHGNWVNLNGVGSGSQCCRDGAAVEVTPEVVMSGPNIVRPFIGDTGPSHDDWNAANAANANYPHTVRFPYGCGEVMYSTYHTSEPAERTALLTPQEMVLLYLILEINECNLDPIKE